MPLARIKMKILLLGVALLALTTPVTAKAGPPAPCEGNVRCIARAAVASTCGNIDEEAITSLAALGLLSDALAAVDEHRCPTNSAAARRGMEIERARTLGRLAVADKAAGRDGSRVLLDRAIDLAARGRRPTAYPYGFCCAYDDVFADAICDLARDYIVIGEIRAGRALIEQTHDIEPYRRAACLGQLSGVLYRLHHEKHAAEFVQTAYTQAARLRGGESASALSGVADGFYETGRLNQALQTLANTGTLVAGKDPFSGLAGGAIRVGYYRFMAIQEAAAGRYENSWRVCEAELKASGFPPWNDLAELLLAMTEAGLPGHARALVARVEQEMGGIPYEKVDPTFRAALGSALLVEGNIIGANAQFAYVRQSAEQQADENTRGYYMVSLVHAYAAAGHIAEGLKMVEQSFPSPENRQTNIDRWTALRFLAMAAVRNGRPEEAMEIAGRSPGSELHDLILHAIVLACARQNNFMDAERWAHQLSSDRGVGEALADIAASAACRSSDTAQWVVASRGELEWRSIPRVVVWPIEPEPVCGAHRSP